MRAGFFAPLVLLGSSSGSYPLGCLGTDSASGKHHPELGMTRGLTLVPGT
jgi:hypothetical protein